MFFSLPQNQDWLCTPYSSIHWVTGNLSLEVEWLECEFKHWPPKWDRNCTSSPPHAFMARTSTTLLLIISKVQELGFTPSDITLPQLHSIWYHPSTIRHVPNNSPSLSHPPPDSECMAFPTWIQSHFHILLGRPIPKTNWMHFNVFCLVRHKKCCDLPGNTIWFKKWT